MADPGAYDYCPCEACNGNLEDPSWFCGDCHDYLTPCPVYDWCTTIYCFGCDDLDKHVHEYGDEPFL